VGAILIEIRARRPPPTTMDISQSQNPSPRPIQISRHKIDGKRRAVGMPLGRAKARDAPAPAIETVRRNYTIFKSACLRRPVAVPYPSVYVFLLYSEESNALGFASWIRLPMFKTGTKCTNMR
jgi:hypothetical protein